MKEIKLQIPDGKNVKWVDGVLTLVDEKPQDVTERIKTFEDACRELGESHPLVKEWQMCGQNLSPDLEAYLRLRIITEALNEDWKPKFTINEYRWFPWFELITNDEYASMDDEEKSRAVLRGGYGSSASSGLVYAYAFNASSYSYSSYGSRLAFKSEKLAAYAGKQFIDIYADFCFLPLRSDTEQK